MSDPAQQLKNLNPNEREVLALLVTADRIKQSVNRQSAVRLVGLDATVARGVLDRLVAMGILNASQGKAINSHYTIAPLYQAAAQALVEHVTLTPVRGANVRKPATPSFDEWLADLHHLQHDPRPWSPSAAISSRLEAADVALHEAGLLAPFWMGLLVSKNGRAYPSPELHHFLALPPDSQVAQILWTLQRADPALAELLLRICRLGQPQQWYYLADIRHLRRSTISQLSEWASDHTDLLRSHLAWPLSVGLISLALSSDGGHVFQVSQLLGDWCKAGAHAQPPAAHRDANRFLTLLLHDTGRLQTLERTWLGSVPAKGTVPERVTSLLTAMTTASHIKAQIHQQPPGTQQILRRMLATRNYTLQGAGSGELTHLKSLQTTGLVFALPAGAEWGLPVELAAPLLAYFEGRDQSDQQSTWLGEAPWMRNDGLSVHSDLLAFWLSLTDLEYDVSTPTNRTFDSYGRPTSTPWLLRRNDQETYYYESRYSWLTGLANQRDWVLSSSSPAALKNKTVFTFLRMPWKQRHYELLRTAHTVATQNQCSLRGLANALLSRPDGAWTRLSWLYEFMLDNPALAGYGSSWNRPTPEGVTNNVNTRLINPLLWLGLLELAAQESGLVAVRLTPLGRELLPMPFEKSAANPGDTSPVSPQVKLRQPGILSIENHPAVVELIYRAARTGNILAVGHTWEIELTGKHLQQVSAKNLAELQRLLQPYRIEVKGQA